MTPKVGPNKSVAYIVTCLNLDVSFIRTFDFNQDFNVNQYNVIKDIIYEMLKQHKNYVEFSARLSIVDTDSMNVHNEPHIMDDQSMYKLIIEHYLNIYYVKGEKIRRFWI
jgi:hypothetical protein